MYPVPVAEFDLKYFSVLRINFLPGLIFLFPRCVDTWARKDFGAQRHSTHYRPSFKPQKGEPHKWHELGETFHPSI